MARRSFKPESPIADALKFPTAVFSLPNIGTDISLTTGRALKRPGTQSEDLQYASDPMKLTPTATTRKRP